MITVYLSTRGDICYTCTGCPHSVSVFNEFRETPFWDHYNGLVIRDMIGHFVGQHTRKQVQRGNAHPSAIVDTVAHAWGTIRG